MMNHDDPCSFGLLESLLESIDLLDKCCFLDQLDLDLIRIPWIEIGVNLTRFSQEIEHFDAGNTVIAVAQIPKISQVRLLFQLVQFDDLK